MQIQKLQKLIGYTFKNPKYLEEALTHPSLAHERGRADTPDNQRLEFLGDAVLQLVLTDRVYDLYPGEPEGTLTQLRAHLANRHTLYRCAQAIHLGEFLRLGRGEENSGGRHRLSNLADALEALIGAIYQDGGIRAARKFVHALFAAEIRQLRHAQRYQNPKGQLQELLQAHAPVNPQYRVIRETGPDHNKQFEAVVEWQGRQIGHGQGSSKKQAETAAAQAALAALQSGALGDLHGLTDANSHND